MLNLVEKSGAQLVNTTKVAGYGPVFFSCLFPHPPQIEDVDLRVQLHPIYKHMAYTFPCVYPLLTTYPHQPLHRFPHARVMQTSLTMKTLKMAKCQFNRNL